MGDIFRRNAFNLGLHVVQSPEAVADARDGDTMTFDTRTRNLTNETQGKSYTPVPLSEKEEEIRERRHLRRRAPGVSARPSRRRPHLTWPGPATRAA